MTEEICHVCKRVKKPYSVFMNNHALSIITYQLARSSGPICQKCDQYFAMTGEFHDATDEEFKNAKKASWFARMVSAWWEKDKKLVLDSTANLENLRDWAGTEDLAKWCRDKLNRKRGKDD